jgi:uncharacterized protein HemX
MKLSLRTVRRVLALACVCALVVLPASAAFAVPAPETPAPVSTPQSSPVSPIEVHTTNYGARTLSIVLASSALLIALGAAAYAVHVGSAQRRTAS